MGFAIRSERDRRVGHEDGRRRLGQATHFQNPAEPNKVTTCGFGRRTDAPPSFFLTLADTPMRCARVEPSVRRPHQANRQQAADDHVKYQTETRPPARYSGIVNEHVVNKIKYSVPNQSSHHPPKISFEADYGNQQKSAGNHDLNYERPARSSHGGKQHVIRGDDDEHGWIKCALPVKASDGG